MQKKYVVRIWTGFMWFIVWSIEHLKELWVHLVGNSLTRWMASFQQVQGTMKSIQYTLLCPSLKCALSSFNCSLQQTVQTPLTWFVQYFSHSKIALHPLQQCQYCPFGKLLNHHAYKDMFILIYCRIIHRFLWLSMFLLSQLFRI